MSKVSYVILILIGIALFSALVLIPHPSDQGQIKRFSSYNELQKFLQTNIGMSYGGEFATFGAMYRTTSITQSEAQASEDYSTTNIQVTGVDEADFVKNDGKYIYVISGNNVDILDAYPAENAKILTKLDFKGTPNELFITKDKLIVIGNSYQSGDYYMTSKVQEIAPRYSSQTFIEVYDISDRPNPILERNVSIDGNYFNSRMIGDYVYIVANQPVYYSKTEPVPLPSITSDNKIKTVPVTEVYYFDVPDESYIFTNIVAINAQNKGEGLSSKTFLMGYSQNMYVSLNNMYIVYNKRVSMVDVYDRIIDKVIIPNVPEDVQKQIKEVSSNTTGYERFYAVGKVFQDYTESYIESLGPEKAAEFMKKLEEKMIDVLIEISKELEKTIIHKIALDGSNIEYKTKGEVPGYVLNQFSMDEFDGYFRIATTTGEVSRVSEGTAANHIYVLNDNLNIVGKLEDVAPGERIYSARFIGDRVYLVTFKKIDPLFVIDLKDPQNPKLLGELEIPGYSDYLHPYDENHIIGIGKETAESGEGNFAWYQGVKIALFDVSDVSNPKEIAKYNIGDRGTESEALHDHKAFLFSREKNLLVIPITLAEINKTKYTDDVPSWVYGDYVWQGAYVFNISVENGFVLKGRITHDNQTEVESYYDYTQVRRSLYIGNILYTISEKTIKANSLTDLSEVKSINLRSI